MTRRNLNQDEYNDNFWAVFSFIFGVIILGASIVGILITAKDVLNMPGPFFGCVMMALISLGLIIKDCRRTYRLAKYWWRQVKFSIRFGKKKSKPSLNEYHIGEE